ncbi:Cytochrome P450 [Penicillium cf. griseofulvum]|nr:Cytochrome P450 [Penicillium cf. griseofulvum]
MSCYYILLTLQFAVVSLILALWHAFKPNTWSNRVVSSIINRVLLWWYPIYSIDGSTPIPTYPYKFPDGGGSIRFLEGENVSRQWAEKYGPIYRIWVGLTPEIILTRADEIKPVFKDSGNHYKASNLNGGWVMGDLVGDGVGLISQGHWKRVHAVVSPPFTQKPTAYVPFVQSRISSHFAEQYMGCERGKTLRIKPAEDLKLLPFWVISDLLYGKLSPEMTEELLLITDLRTDVFQYAFKGGLSLFSISKIFYPAIRKKLHVFHTRWAHFNQKAYHDAKDRDDASACAIVTLYTAVEQGRITPTELMHTLDEALFANIDVTIGSFSWIPQFLAEDADLQTELREEISKARSDKTAESWVSYIASNTTLLASCINESARLKPVTNYTYAQSMPSDRDVGEYRIPRGTFMVVDTNALNIWNDVWGSDKLTFRPGRFLEESRSSFRYRFWRFGFGPRQCIAQALADTILKVLVAYTVENYELKLPGKSTMDEKNGQKRGEAWFKVAEQEIILEAL